MAKHARRESKLECMGSYVESLLVDIRGDLKHALRHQQAASQASLKIAILTLLPLPAVILTELCTERR